MNYCYLYFIVIIKNMNKIPIEMKNGFILIQDIKNETTESGLYIPDEKYNRFAKVRKGNEGSK